MFLWHRKCYLFALDLSRWVSVFTTEPQWFPGNGNCLCARQMPHTKLGWEKPLCQIWNLSKIEDWGSTHAEKHDLFLIDLSNLIFHFTMCRWTNLKNLQRNIREKLVTVHVNMHVRTKHQCFWAILNMKQTRKRLQIGQTSEETNFYRYEESSVPSLTTITLLTVFVPIAGVILFHNWLFRMDSSNSPVCFNHYNIHNKITWFWFWR